MESKTRINHLIRKGKHFIVSGGDVDFKYI